MEPWNDAYRQEAEAIAASVVADWGERWAALEIFRGRRRDHRDVAIAMRALMFARGEFDGSGLNKLHDQLIHENLRKR
jgi:hypothetical protein